MRVHAVLAGITRLPRHPPPCSKIAAAIRRTSFATDRHRAYRTKSDNRANQDGHESGAVRPVFGVRLHHGEPHEALDHFIDRLSARLVE